MWLKKYNTSNTPGENSIVPQQFHKTRCVGYKQITNMVLLNWILKNFVKKKHVLRIIFNPGIQRTLICYFKHITFFSELFNWFFVTTSQQKLSLNNLYNKTIAAVGFFLISHKKERFTFKNSRLTLLKHSLISLSIFYRNKLEHPHHCCTHHDAASTPQCIFFFLHFNKCS